jgi:hypothetical protein
MNGQVFDPQHPVVRAYRKCPDFFRPFTDRFKVPVTSAQLFQFMTISYDQGWFNPGCVTPTIEYPMKSSYSQNYIDYARNLIYQKTVEIIGCNNPRDIDAKLLAFVCSLYFELFVEKEPRYVSYAINYKNKTRVGECVTTRESGEENRHEIILSGKVINSCFKESCEPLVVNGIKVSDRTQLILVSVEHEIIHYLINNSNYDIVKVGCSNRDKTFGPHGSMFKSVAKAFFGHTKFNCCLKHEDDDKREEIKGKLSIDQEVSFKYGGETITGKVGALNSKTAKVIVEKSDAIIHYAVHYEDLLLSSPSEKK